MQTRSRGFTLIELMIVVAIIAILAAVAIPAYSTYTIRAQVAEGLSLAEGYKTVLWDYYAQHGSFPASNQAANAPSPSSIQGNYVQSVNIANGVITILYGNHANTAISGQSIELSGASNSGAVLTWTCKHNSVATAYLPSSCQ